MKKVYWVYSLFAVLLFFACKTSLATIDSTGRQIRPSEASSFHSAVRMRIAWFPYKDLTIKQKSDNTWQVVKNDPDAKKSAMPVILIEYEGKTDSIWLDMNTSNEMLGRLIKHTLMTEEPIKKPYTEFFEVAKCSKCHPEDIDKGFEGL